MPAAGTEKVAETLAEPQDVATVGKLPIRPVCWGTGVRPPGGKLVYKGYLAGPINQAEIKSVPPWGILPVLSLFFSSLTHEPSQGFLGWFYSGFLLRSWDIVAAQSLSATSLRYEGG